jgi:hypothetical protein
MRATLTRLALLCSLAALTACVGDDTVQARDDAGFYPSDASSNVDSTVPQDYGDDSGNDDTGAPTDDTGVAPTADASDGAAAKSDASDAAMDALPDATFDASDASLDAADAGG